TRERLALAGDARALEMRACHREQLRRGRVRLGVRPADDRLAGLDGERILDLAAKLLRRDDDELRAARAANALVDLAPDCLQVFGDELLDMTLEARLRPPALVVLAGLLLAAIDDLFEPTGTQSEDDAAFA